MLKKEKIKKIKTENKNLNNIGTYVATSTKTRANALVFSNVGGFAPYDRNTNTDTNIKKFKPYKNGNILIPYTLYQTLDPYMIHLFSIFVYFKEKEIRISITKLMDLTNHDYYNVKNALNNLICLGYLKIDYNHEYSSKKYSKNELPLYKVTHLNAGERYLQLPEYLILNNNIISSDLLVYLTIVSKSINNTCYSLSAKDISKILNYTDRNIRYRLVNLKNLGFISSNNTIKRNKKKGKNKYFLGYKKLNKNMFSSKLKDLGLEYLYQKFGNNFEHISDYDLNSNEQYTLAINLFKLFIESKDISYRNNLAVILLEYVNLDIINNKFLLKDISFINSLYTEINNILKYKYNDIKIPHEKINYILNYICKCLRTELNVYTRNAEFSIFKVIFICIKQIRDNLKNSNTFRLYDYEKYLELKYAEYKDNEYIDYLKENISQKYIIRDWIYRRISSVFKTLDNMFMKIEFKIKKYKTYIDFHCGDIWFLESTKLA